MTGRIKDAQLRTYGWIELAIGILGVATLWELTAAQMIYEGVVRGGGD